MCDIGARHCVSRRIITSGALLCTPRRIEGTITAATMRAALSPPSSSCLPPICLSLANTASTLSSSAGFLDCRLVHPSDSRPVVTEAGSSVAPAILDHRLFLGGALHLEVEVDLGAQAERHRVQRLELLRRSSGCARGSTAMVDLVVPTRRMICASLSSGWLRTSQQDGVRAVLAARHRRVARALLFLASGTRTLGSDICKRRSGSASASAISSRDELAGRDRVHALDALRGIAVGDGLHLERVQLAEVGDLVERQRGVLDEPDGGRLRHQRRGRGKSPALRPPSGRSLLSSG